MEECLLPSEIARLVFGYLQDEGCNEAAQKFLETSENLKECQKTSNQGSRFRTRVLGFNLVEMLQLVSSVYSLVEERTRKFPVPKEIARGSFIEQLSYLLNVEDQACDGPGFIKVLERTMFENTKFHRKLADNINKMITAPERFAPETIAESIVKEKGFEELIEELLDAVPATQLNQTNGKSSKENRPIANGSNSHHSPKENCKKRATDILSNHGKSISNCNQFSIEDENAAAVQSILDSSRWSGSWKNKSDQQDQTSYSSKTPRKTMDIFNPCEPSISNQTTTNNFTQLEEMVVKNSNYCSSQVMSSNPPTEEMESNNRTERVDSAVEDEADNTALKPPCDYSDVQSLVTDQCQNTIDSSCKTGVNVSVSSGLNDSSHQVLKCSPILLVCNSQNTPKASATELVQNDIHLKAEDRPIRKKLRRILPKVTNSSALEIGVNNKILLPNGITLEVINQSSEKPSESENPSDEAAQLSHDSFEKIIEDSVIKSLVLGEQPLKVSEESDSSVKGKDMQYIQTELCTAEILSDNQDKTIITSDSVKSDKCDKRATENRITPVDRQITRKKLSLTSPRRGRHIRSLDFTTPNKKVRHQRSRTSPKQIRYSPKFRHSKLRSNLFKSPPNKLQLIKDAAVIRDKLAHSVERNSVPIINDNNQDATQTSNSDAKKSSFDSNELRISNKDELREGNTCVQKNKALSSWDSNLRVLVGENTNSSHIKKHKRQVTKRVLEMNRRSKLKKIVEVNEMSCSRDIIKDQTSSQAISGISSNDCQKNDSESSGSKDISPEETNVNSSKSLEIEPKKSPQIIFQTPLKLIEPLIPQTPILDTPMLKSILDETKVMDSDLLLTPSFQLTPFKPSSEKKVLVQTLSPSKMLSKKSPTYRNSTYNSSTASGYRSTVTKKVLPNCNETDNFEQNVSDRTQTSKNSLKNNESPGKSDLILSLMKQAEKHILGNISDGESDADDHDLIGEKSKTGSNRSKNNKNCQSSSKASNSDGSCVHISNSSPIQNKVRKSGTESSSEKLKSKVENDSIGSRKDCTSEPNSPHTSSACKRNNALQNNTREAMKNVSPSKMSPESSVTNHSVKNNSETSFEYNSSTSVVKYSVEESSNLVEGASTSSCSSFPPKKKYVQTILLSTATSMKSKKSLASKDIGVNKKMSVASSLKQEDEIKDQQCSEENKSAEIVTIESLLEKKKRLLNQLRQPCTKPKKKKNSADPPLVKSSVNILEDQTKNVKKATCNNFGRSKTQINSKIKNHSNSASVPESINETLPNFSDETSLSPVKTSTPYVNKLSKSRTTAMKNAESKFSPNNRRGKTFSEITTERNNFKSSIDSTDKGTPVVKSSSPEKRSVKSPSCHPVETEWAPLKKCGIEKRVIVGNELYEHIVFDEKLPIKAKSQQNVENDKDFSISIFDVDVDGREVETVFVAQPLTTLFEFIPVDNCRRIQPEAEHSNQKTTDTEDKKKRIISPQPETGLSNSKTTDTENEKKKIQPEGINEITSLNDRSSRLLHSALNSSALNKDSSKSHRDNSLRNLRIIRRRSLAEKHRSRDRYSSSSSPLRKASREKYRNASNTRNVDRATSSHHRNQIHRERLNDRQKIRNHFSDKSEERNREERRNTGESRRSRTKSSSRSRNRSRSSGRLRRKESRTVSRKYRDESRHSSSSRTKLSHESARSSDQMQLTSREDDVYSSEEGEIRSKVRDSSDECDNVASQSKLSSRKALDDSPPSRLPSRSLSRKRPASDENRSNAEKRHKTGDAQKLLKNMDSEHLEKFLSVVHPED